MVLLLLLFYASCTYTPTLMKFILNNTSNRVNFVKYLNVNNFYVGTIIKNAIIENIIATIVYSMTNYVRYLLIN